MAALSRCENGIPDVTPQGDYIAIAERNSKDSPFLRLPAELRIKIYELALGGRRLILSSRLLRATSRDLSTSPISSEWQIPPCSSFAMRAFSASKSTPPPGPRPVTNVSKVQSTAKPTGFELLQVCRQIYTETAILPYSLNLFHGETLLRDSLLIMDSNLLTVEGPGKWIKTFQWKAITKMDLIAVDGYVNRVSLENLRKFTGLKTLILRSLNSPLVPQWKREMSLRESVEDIKLVTKEAVEVILGLPESYFLA
ncbi:hypothetical protein P154DRAFT_565366 [Amniculicola lignicola CBS 123094]|uniref:DUF7730 domain-containing protein n=1 Tax=Amniculicola lignicola CBS 123094 TaxID=1392246 RepID=A0A6A5W9B8_9PLEO|nr:hypothetical protein P154DRAFT_565366 [Amniculicola lignicola CBS 123094]